MDKSIVSPFLTHGVVAEWYGAGLGDREGAGSNPARGCCVPRPTKRAIPSVMSTNECWVVNGHTTRRTGPIFVVLRLRLVSGWWLQGKEFGAALWAHEAREGLYFFTYDTIGNVQRPVKNLIGGQLNLPYNRKHKIKGKKLKWQTTVGVTKLIWSVRESSAEENISPWWKGYVEQMDFELRAKSDVMDGNIGDRGM